VLVVLADTEPVEGGVAGLKEVLSEANSEQPDPKQVEVLEVDELEVASGGEAVLLTDEDEDSGTDAVGVTDVKGTELTDADGELKQSLP
jgi:hypothetical protein